MEWFADSEEPRQGKVGRVGAFPAGSAAKAEAILIFDPNGVPFAFYFTLSPAERQKTLREFLLHLAGPKQI